MQRRVVLSLALVCTLVLGGLAAATTASATTRPATRYALAAIHATNAQRGGHHLRTLTFDQCLKRLATRQAARMARQRALSHQSMTAALRTCHLHAVGGPLRPELEY